MPWALKEWATSGGVIPSGVAGRDVISASTEGLLANANGHMQYSLCCAVLCIGGCPFKGDLRGTTAKADLVSMALLQ